MNYQEKKLTTDNKNGIIIEIISDLYTDKIEKSMTGLKTEVLKKVNVSNKKLGFTKKQIESGLVKTEKSVRILNIKNVEYGLVCLPYCFRKDLGVGYRDTLTLWIKDSLIISDERFQYEPTKKAISCLNNLAKLGREIEILKSSLSSVIKAGRTFSAINKQLPEFEKYLKTCAVWSDLTKDESIKQVQSLELEKIAKSKIRKLIKNKEK